MSEKFAKLKTLIAEVLDLNMAQALLGWDQQTYMPPGGAEARGKLRLLPKEWLNLDPEFCAWTAEQMRRQS